MKRRDAPLSAYLVYITAPDRDTARAIAATLVEERLAACVNVLPGITSFYRWKGALEESQEVAIIAKTLESTFSKLTTRLQQIHPYECPCIVALPIAEGHAPFLQWIADSVIA